MDVQDSPRKSYWRCSKQDFFPEPSFKDLSSYRTALSQICPRLKDRLLSRSTETHELVTLRRERQEARENAGPAIVLSYALSGFSALLSVFCYTEFAVEIPVAGGSFSYLRVELGDFIAYLAAGNILLEAVIGAAGLGRSWSSYFASMINTKNPDFMRIKIASFADGFNLLDPLAVVVLLVANSIAMSGTKRTSFLNWIASIATAFIIVFIIVVGLIHFKSSNLVPYFPRGAEGVFKSAAVVYWAYTGFDMVATMAEETKNPSRDIPIGLVGSMSIITVVYCLMALALTGMVKYTEIDPNAAFSVAFAQIGMKWATYLVSICALKGMTTSLMVGSLGQGRYTTQIARSHMIPPWFARVHPKTGTPIYATLLTTILSAIVAFFTSLDVLSSVFSIFYSTYFHVIGCCIACVKGWIGYVVASVIWCSGTLGISLLHKNRVPKAWGVPLVPWLPSLSIAMNVFLLGSLGYVAFLRFIICSAVMILYYLVVGVHATYDVAHHNPKETEVEVGR
ncbi:INNER MEMBRANE TRANSPORTER YGJI-RELATED [Salix koriyanagi]|uniref:INNER MEMBRANE TRANSPORTER YGJI-RELATED n=1 Tax=Salix koriyanagi TaxID=2511006 RepID=A0A9Q1AM91_9ROSI|nr:INNER MEMBRANE TRANSPORTER YGJI-RELATED [Salix koriyanagi]